MTSYDPTEFQFQVHNDAVVTETAYLCPHGLPWGAALEITPSQAQIPPGQTAIFTCRISLDGEIIRPGCTNDQGFRLTAWRVAEDADEPWGSCFYFLRPRVRTQIDVDKVDWYEQELSVHGTLRLDTDQVVALADHLPLRVRIRLETDAAENPVRAWSVLTVQPNGTFSLHRIDFSGPPGVKLRVQAWFDRTDLLASSRSNLIEATHHVAPVIH